MHVSRQIEALQHKVEPNGLVIVQSSGQLAESSGPAARCVHACMKAGWLARRIRLPRQWLPQRGDLPAPAERPRRRSKRHLLVRLAKGVVGESHGDRGLAHRAVAQQDDLVLQHLVVIAVAHRALAQGAWFSM